VGAGSGVDVGVGVRGVGLEAMVGSSVGKGIGVDVGADVGWQLQAAEISASRHIDLRIGMRSDFIPCHSFRGSRCGPRSLTGGALL
jgi:hypothetical protein